MTLVSECHFEYTIEYIIIIKLYMLVEKNDFIIHEKNVFIRFPLLLIVE